MNIAISLHHNAYIIKGLLLLKHLWYVVKARPKPRVVEPSCLAYAILAPLALFFVDLHKASLPQNMSVRRGLKNGAGCIL